LGNSENRNINSSTFHLFSFQTLGNKWDHNIIMGTQYLIVRQGVGA